MTAPPPKQAPPLSIGTVVADKYRIESLLGEGGMGFVFAALHLQLGHRVALKVLHTAQTSEPEITQRFLREGRALARLQSEHIARVSDVGTLSSGEPYLVMEFLEGQDLARELVSRGPFAIVDAVDFVAQTCEALAEAHVRGIVHRDLKPANLFLTHKLDGDVCIKVLDFGISKMSPIDGPALEVDNITVTSTIVGTPKYMSPEQIQDSRSVDLRTDIWGLGTIFYELLTQKRPFAAPSLALVCVKVLHEEVPAPSTLREEIPAGIDAIIARCLKKNPTERFANVGELVEALIPFNPSVRSSATRIQRILTADIRSSGPRVSSADSSGSQPGALNVSSSPHLGDSAQPISRTPSAVRVDKDVMATLTGMPTVVENVAKKTRRNLALAIGGALVVGGGIVFIATRSSSEAPHAPTPASASIDTHPIVAEIKSVAPIVSVDPGASASVAASAASSAHAHAHPPIVHNTHVTSQPTATQTAPKGTGDVLEDRH